MSLSFRIGGKLTERLVSVDDQVTPAKSSPASTRRTWRASFAPRRPISRRRSATLVQAEADEKRQAELLRKKRVIAQARYDQAEQALETARSQVEAANARAKSARDKVSYAELHADGAGSVTATGAEAGEVVSAGQMIVTVAREGARDAVFNVPAQLLRTAPRDPKVHVALADDPA